MFPQVFDGVHSPNIKFDEISSLMNRKVTIAHRDVEGRLKDLAAAPEEDDHLLNLSDYVNTSTVAVLTTFSLLRTHIVFR